MSHRLLLCFLLLAACTSQPPTAEVSTPEQQAASAALKSYEALYAGHIEQFLDAQQWAETMPQSHRQQLINSFRHHQLQVQRLHRGVKNVSVTRAVSDSTLQIVQVFLLLSYGDGQQEEIVVPMVEHQERWRIK